MPSRYCMKLWIGAETQAEVTESFRSIRTEMERAINNEIESFNTDIGVDGWDCLVILREDCHLPEVIKYSLAKREMDFRLLMDYQAFVKATPKGRQQLLFALLLRSLSLLKHKSTRIAEVDELTARVRAIGTKKGWLEATKEKPLKGSKAK
jgi:hypothetical protein